MDLGFLTAVIMDGLIIAACIVECSLLLQTRHRRYTKKFEPIEILLFSLCISDFLSGAFMLLGDICMWYAFIVYDNPERAPIAFIVDPLIALFVLLSSFHVMSIAMERLVAVALPRKYSVLDNTCYKFLTVSLIWVVAGLFVGVVYQITWSYTCDCTTTSVLGYAYACACAFVFATYTMLFVLLMLRERKLKKLLGADLRKHSRSRRNTYICLLLGCSFVVCVLPFSIGSIEPDYFFGVLPSLLTMNHMFNPIVYFVKYYVDRRRRGASNLSAATVKYNRSSSQTPTTITSMSTSSNGCNVNNACVNHVCNDC